MIGEILVSGLLIIGGVFGLVGSWGLIRLPDPMTRLHAPTKSATLGVGAVLVASMLWFPLRGGQASWHEFLIALFLFLTAPVTGNMIAKANLHLGDPAKVPPPPKGDWATFSDREEP
ncbi:Na+/H+ antiporter subunit G [Paracoccus yeei]|uniref:Na+/H+ antiporter subunit G n=1 Tax=Paracoccus yeei TaxID=147645 RepID=A0A5P2QZL2_9RHOB|nr:Na+/H+ antiporter subunit G [Paracoccus yeei]QEU09962.1 Na+/H+ antiporter subunit G [Paracoccus yeei]